MEIRDLEQLQDIAPMQWIRGGVDTIAFGNVSTGDGYASAGAYAGALGEASATNVHAQTRTREGRWSRISKANARADASASGQGEQSHASYSGRSTYFGLESGFVQIGSSSSFSTDS